MSTPFKSEWLQPGAIVQVDIPTLAAFAEELRRVNQENQALRQALETEQEPVAWMHNVIEANVITHIPADIGRHPERWTPLYTAPCQTCQSLAMAVMNDQTYHEKVIPKRAWVGLTDGEIDILSCEMVKGYKSVNWLCKVLETKLKEKNHG